VLYKSIGNEGWSWWWIWQGKRPFLRMQWYKFTATTLKRLENKKRMLKSKVGAIIQLSVL